MTSSQAVETSASSDSSVTNKICFQYTHKNDHIRLMVLLLKVVSNFKLQFERSQSQNIRQKCFTEESTSLK